MRVAIVVAMSRDGLIGTETGLPWRLPNDWKRFRQLTWGKPLIVGRKTFQTLGSPLKGREHIVLTRDLSYRAEGVHVVHEPAAALSLAKQIAERDGVDEVMVIGGGEVYRALLPFAGRMYLTIVEGEFTGSVFFPEPVTPGERWRFIHEEYHPADAKNPHASRFLILDTNSFPLA